MAGAVSQHQLAPFTTPTNGTIGDADEVRGNLNDIVNAHDAHDDDTTIHVQSANLASRPSAVAEGSVFVSLDGRRIYVDSGVAWAEVAYMPHTNGVYAPSLTDATTTSFTNGVLGVSLNSTHAAGSRGGGLALKGMVTQSGAGTYGTMAATYGLASSAGGSGTRMEAVAGAADCTAGVPDSLSGVVGVATVSGGTPNVVAVLRSEGVTVSGGSATSIVGCLIGSNAVTGGSATTSWGLKIEDQASSGAGTSYAIQTGTGNVKFGGPVAVNGSPPHAKVAITGSRGGNAALANLLTELAALGWITDSTSA